MPIIHKQLILMIIFQAHYGQNKNIHGTIFELNETKLKTEIPLYIPTALLLEEKTF